MHVFTPRRHRRIMTTRGSAVLVATALSLSSMTFGSFSADAAAPRHDAARAVSFHGFQVVVPAGWRVVDLAARPHACIRFDTSAVYLGSASDQADCPAHLVGGAPSMQVQALTGLALSGFAGPVLRTPRSAGGIEVRLPTRGPVGIAVPAAGVLATLMYGPASAALMQGIVSRSGVTSGAHAHDAGAPPQGDEETGVGVSVPGDFQGLGFDACTAPSQALMDAWRASSDYGSIGVYIGGMNMACAQPNLTAEWVSRQVTNGWHLVPVYVGYQAPCSAYRNRMSYDVPTARKQGQAEAADAMAMAGTRGIVAPSTLYSDMEGYDSSDENCVDAVMSYLSGWTFAMHTKAYQSGVYSSASSGMHDLSTHHDSLGPSRPDDLFMAWWNHQKDVDGGSYVPPEQWSYQQRVHQYEGESTESHGGYNLAIDRNFLDVSSVVQAPVGCPTNLDFKAYPFIRWPAEGDEVRAVQCLLARTGFDPGPATGDFNWRTTAASRAFKASRGMASQESSIAKYAWAALISAGTTRPVYMGSTGPWVRKVQRALTARMQRTVPIDGVFARSTRHAVRLYQKALGRTQTGKVYAPTWRALRAGL